jgi:hypothetical protein
MKPSAWLLDSSTFINFLVIDGIRLLLRLRSPLFLPEYVYRVELGLNAREATRRGVEECIRSGKIGLQQLSVADLDRLASLAVPRQVGLGEIACALIAERASGGVLCDDWRARSWLERYTRPACWNSTEDVLLEAAGVYEISEYDLMSLQLKLEQGRYRCRIDLRLEFLQRQATRGEEG